MTFSRVRVVVIGGGAAGICAAVSASYAGASVELKQRESRLGGKLKQSIQDNFGFVRYDDALAGPEYAFRDISALEKTNTIVLLQTSIVNIVRIDNTFQLTTSSRHGVAVIEAGAIVLATGCREKTLAEIGIFGTEPSGVFSAGACQYYTNIRGQLPSHRCVVLGTDNLSLAMTHRLALSGTKILGVYEPDSMPRGYLDYVSRYVFDHSIELHTQHTVTRLYGMSRLRAVEVVSVDDNGNHIRKSENIIQCDGFMYSGGFVPDNELAVSLGVPISKRTNGPSCDQSRMTLVDGVFSCGNALHFNDLVDYISETGEIAGRYAANYLPRERHLVRINVSNDYLTVSPQYIDCDILYDNPVLFLTSKRRLRNVKLRISADGTEVFSQEYDSLRPYEAQRIDVDFASALTPESSINLMMS